MPLSFLLTVSWVVLIISVSLLALCFQAEDPFYPFRDFCLSIVDRIGGMDFLFNHSRIAARISFLVYAFTATMIYGLPGFLKALTLLVLFGFVYYLYNSLSYTRGRLMGLIGRTKEENQMRRRAVLSFAILILFLFLTN